MEREITEEMLNEVLAEASRDRGECLCIHPFMQIINMTGLRCKWCEQILPEAAVSPRYKEIRTEEIKRRRPEWVKDAVE